VVAGAFRAQARWFTEETVSSIESEMTFDPAVIIAPYTQVSLVFADPISAKSPGYITLSMIYAD
jgi:hypothetical protein